MSRREIRALVLAVQILREIARGRISPDGQGVVLRLAMTVLLPHVRRRALDSFWSVAANENPSQRRHNLRALLALIEADVRRAILGSEP